jgi:hypothetical protein
LITRSPYRSAGGQEKRSAIEEQYWGDNSILFLHK